MRAHQDWRTGRPPARHAEVVQYASRIAAGRVLADHLRNALAADARADAPDAPSDAVGDASGVRSDAAQAVVLALPRGGVPVGAEVARALGAPLDVLVARKIGAARQPEYAVAAIAEGGAAVIDRAAVRASRTSELQLRRTVDAERRELARRVTAYRGDLAPAAVTGRTAVLVDDGLATGLTAIAAVRALRALEPARLVVAAPVGSDSAVAALGREADLVVCPLVPDPFRAVGDWYVDFAQTTDDEVLALLASA